MSALAEVGVAAGLLGIGLLMILVGGYFAPTQDWLFWLGGLMALIGGFGVGQSLLGLVIEASVGMNAAMALLCVVILGFVVFQGYGVLVE